MILPTTPFSRRGWEAFPSAFVVFSCRQKPPMDASLNPVFKDRSNLARRAAPSKALCFSLNLHRNQRNRPPNNFSDQQSVRRWKSLAIKAPLQASQSKQKQKEKNFSSHLQSSLERFESMLVSSLVWSRR